MIIYHHSWSYITTFIIYHHIYYKLVYHHIEHLIYNTICFYILYILCIYIYIWPSLWWSPHPLEMVMVPMTSWLLLVDCLCRWQELTFLKLHGPAVTVQACMVCWTVESLRWLPYHIHIYIYNIILCIRYIIILYIWYYKYIYIYVLLYDDVGSHHPTLIYPVCSLTCW